MPTIHGEDAVLRVLDKESMSEKFAKLSLDVVGFSESDLTKFRRYIKSLTAWCWSGSYRFRQKPPRSTPL